MKKIFSIILSICLLFSLAACGSAESSAAEQTVDDGSRHCGIG